MLKKFILSHDNNTKEIDFFEAANYLKCNKPEKKHTINESFYKLLEMNKKYFELITS